MFGSLAECLAPPRLNATTPAIFWTDAHIAQQLLAVHLDPNTDLASRNPAFVARSIDWIAATMPPAQYPELLDVGCGPGLYAAQLARAGYAVTGVDFSANSIAFARDSAQIQGLSIAYLCQDYLQMDLQEACDVALMIYCDYGALSTANRKRLLGNVQAALKPGGRFLLDVCSIRHYDAFVESQTWEVQHGGFWSAGQYLCLTANRKYEDDTTLSHYVVMTERDLKIYYIWNHCFTPASLTAECAAAGFRALDVCGDVAGTPYTDASMTLAILLEK